eukprot:6193109-Karenia_brevis.AAC.1
MAFDNMLHDILEKALRKRNVHPLTIFNTLRELSFIRARMQLPGCDASELYDFLKGGKQGG